MIRTIAGLFVFAVACSHRSPVDPADVVCAALDEGEPAVAAYAGGDRDRFRQAVRVAVTDRCPEHAANPSVRVVLGG